MTQTVKRSRQWKEKEKAALGGAGCKWPKMRNGRK